MFLQPCSSLPQVHASDLSNLSLRNPILCEAFLLGVRSGLLGAEPLPDTILRNSFGDGVKDPFVKEGLYELELDIRALFEVAPEFRDLKQFAKKWNLKEDETLDVLAFYSTHVFYNDIRIAGDPELFGKRLKILRDTMSTTAPQMTSPDMITPNAERHETTTLLLERYKRQIDAVQKIVDWILANGRFPKVDFFTKKPGDVGILRHPLFGTSQYNQGKINHPNRIFNSSNEVWLAVKRYSKLKGLKIKLLNAGTALNCAHPDIFRPEWQEEAIDMILEWAQKHCQRMPGPANFGPAPGQVPINYDILTASGKYRTKGNLYEQWIFSSEAEAFTAVKDEAKRRGQFLIL